MASLPPVSGAERLRARRWDAVVLGSGVAALVAAARLGAAGHRVLVVEEDATRALHPALREPFFLAGARDGGVLGVCLRELNIPLIDQRRVAAEHLAYQVVSPKFRLDVGSPSLTARELDVWGLCEPEVAGSLVRALAEATEAERRVMLASPLVRMGRRISVGRAVTPGSHVRGLPAEAASPPPDLAPVLAAQVAALSNLPRGETAAPEARARLLGSALAGGAGFADAPPWLLGLLRRRVEAVYGEFRSVAGRFDLVASGNQPAIALPDSGDLWVGRALVIAAPASALDAALENGLPAGLLGPPRPRQQRLAIHLRVRREVVPPGMCPRVILIDGGKSASDADGLITVTAFPAPKGGEDVDLVARMVIGQDADIAACEDAIEARIKALIPFCDGHVSRRPLRRPAWDDEDGWLEEPAPGSGWPAEIDLRVSSRPAVYRLDRAEVAGLGLEGDLLLGWRAGDAIAAELG